MSVISMFKLLYLLNVYALLLNLNFEEQKDDENIGISVLLDIVVQEYSGKMLGCWGFFVGFFFLFVYLDFF